MTSNFLRNCLVVVLVAPLVVPAVCLALSQHILHTFHARLTGDDDMEKPLPDLPQPAPVPSPLPPTPTTRGIALSVAARAHLHRLLQHIIEEEADLRDRDAWAECLEASLDELGAALTRGGWLAGLRRAREIRKQVHDEAERIRYEARAERMRKEEEERARKGTAKSKPSRLRESVSDEDDAPRAKTTEEQTEILDKVREVAAKPPPPSPKPSTKHLVLSVSGPPSTEPAEDMGFRLVRAAPQCSFRADEFWLPKTVVGVDNTEPVVLYGLDEWEDSLLESGGPVQVVGGTFVLRGTLSFSQYAALCRVLRIAIYAYFSILLEQDLFTNSRLELHYPKPTMPHLPSFPTTPERLSSSSGNRDKSKRDSAGLWGFLSKKTEEMLHRASNIPAGLVRRSSVDGHTRLSRHTSLPHGPDGGFLARRLSLISGSSRASHDSGAEPHKVTYAVAVRKMDGWKDLLSTSPGAVFPLPKFLHAIAELETKDPERRLVGDERAALTSLLGWRGRESLGRGMVGVDGFVRHQGLTALYSEYVPGMSALLSPPPTPSKTDDDTAPAEPPFLLRTVCGGHRRTWLKPRYYQHRSRWDESLGEAVIRWCETADEPCNYPGCAFTRAEHDRRWVHAGFRLLAEVNLPTASDGSTSDDQVRMWHSCAVCGKETPKQVMRDGTFMFSFAKYLELLIYSPAVHTLDPHLCAHTTMPKKPWLREDLPIPSARFNIIRRFSYKGCTVTFTLSEVKDVLEVRVPRLQLLRRKEKKSDAIDHTPSKKSPGAPGETHRILRREIMKWWQGLAEHMDQLEDKFVSDHPSQFHKALPRLPSIDDAREDEDSSPTPTGSAQPLPSTPSTPRAIPLGPKNSHPSLSDDRSGSSPSSVMPASASTSVLSTTTIATETLSVVTNDDGDSLQRLSDLRFKFQKIEQELYVELAQTSEKRLNDVRRSFFTAAKGATRRLSAWEKKHLTVSGSKEAPRDAPVAPEPEWWKSGCHAVPGGNVIVRENDWGSIIAFTLSTADYQRELANMGASPRSVTAPAPPTTPSLASGSPPRPSIFRAGESFRRLVSGTTQVQPDPDHDETGWHEPEAYSAVISRKENPRDPVSLTALRDVLRQRASGDTGSSSMLSSAGLPIGRGGVDSPQAVRAKAAVEISTLAADGQVSGMAEAVEAAGKILHDLDAVSKANASNTSLSDSRHSGSSAFEASIRRPNASSILSDSDGSTVQEVPSRAVTPPPLPPKGPTEQPDITESDDAAPPTPPAKPSNSTFTAGLASSLSSAMRYVLKPGDTPRAGAGGAPHHALLSAATAGSGADAIDERPHIKYDWTVGKRLRFSCTVYYARQFDQLRKRCGVEDVFLQSMARSDNWAAEGGKSKSNFWKTADDRFIIKTLVNAWNVADLQVLIDLGPSYFKYMESTATRPTVLAKLLGFYTVEIRNLESGTTQAKADLLVMENLFYDRKISKTFDLKGIQGRKVKASTGANSKTLFDGEWIEGQQRALTLVQPHSKFVLQEAIKADCEFLAKSNIMDYSLLLGIDEESKEMVCGLVDTIGSYTFAKTLEYKAKQGLNSGSGKEVTVVPPNEYQERFVNAMDDYFLACPSKWSRPLDNAPIPSNYRDLPSVL